MPTPFRLRSSFRIDPLFILLCTYLAILWVAGGASRADALGQAVVRSAGWMALIGVILLGNRLELRPVRPVLALLLALLALILLQLVPLPPGIWQALPGRGPLTQAALAVGEGQPWRPVAMVPGAAVNAAFSLVVPFTVLLLLMGLSERARNRLPGLLLGIAAASMIIGLLQFSGGWFDNPFVNDSADQVSGTFANRNHLALFEALGMLIAPAWAFLDVGKAQWRAPAAFGLVIVFALTILASGSRAGLLVGALALAIGLLLAWGGIRHLLQRAPPWALPALLAAVAAIVAGAVFLSVLTDRAVAIQRAAEVDPQQDARALALPTVVDMVRTYFPAGSGFGGFDRIFGVHEPFALLAPTYFNHAHNDWLEVVLDGGLGGIALLAIAIGWWGWASVRAWRRTDGGGLARLGSAMLLLIAIASAFDYPGRTPLIMASMTIAAMWLSAGTSAGEVALPRGNQHL